MKKYMIISILLILLAFSGCKKQEQVVGGDKDEHGCISSAGYTWCESSQKCMRLWEEECPMTQDLCEKFEGHWSDCSSRCVIDNQGNSDVVCIQVCDELCECSGIAGWNCPPGYECNMPAGIADALGYCVSTVGTES